jgi:hypothetical protein
MFGAGGNMLKLALLFLLISMHARLLGFHRFGARAEVLAGWARGCSSQLRGMTRINLG